MLSTAKRGNLVKLRILLIEDTPAEADSFKRAVTRINPDAEVVVVTGPNEAFHQLDGDIPFDRLCIDPDIGQTMGYDRFIKDIRRYEVPVEILMSDRTSPQFVRYLQQIASSHDEVNLLSRNDQEGLRDLIERMLKEKSGGNTTLRVEQAKQEIRLINLEQGVKEIQTATAEQLKMFYQLSGTVSEFSIRLSLSTEAIDQLKQDVHQFREELQDVSNVAEAIAEKHSGDDLSDRNKVWIAWIAAGSAVITGLGIPLIDKVFPKSDGHVRPAQISPSTPASTKNEGQK